MPSTSTDPRTGWDADDAAALALESAWALRAGAPLRAAARPLAVLLMAAAARARAQGGGLTPAQQKRLREQVAAALALLGVSIAAQITLAIQAARALAVQQEAAALAAFGIDAARLDPGIQDAALAGAGRAADQSVARAVAALERVAAGPLAAPGELEQLATLALAPARAAETAARWAVNRALSDTALALTLAANRPARAGQPPTSANGRTPLTAPGLVVVWVAERDACLTCLALSGDVLDPMSGSGFDEHATFGPRGSAPGVWPPGMPLMGPPRHPHCRCRLRIIAATNTAVPAALKREAERSVARGWSGHASRRSRLGAADALVRRANRLPRTVNERAARDVAAGSFSTRHHPRAGHLRAD